MVSSSVLVGGEVVVPDGVDDVGQTVTKVNISAD